MRIVTLIDAPREFCFDLIRDTRILESGTEITGPFALGQKVTFRSRWLTFEQNLEVRVVKFDRPRYFVDEMTEGKFRSFLHTHAFEDADGCTRLVDILEWQTPYGILGKLIDAVILRPRLRKIVTERNSKLKELAEQHGS